MFHKIIISVFLTFIARLLLTINYNKHVITGDIWTCVSKSPCAIINMGV